jgi:hypothetical protein
MMLPMAVLDRDQMCCLYGKLNQCTEGGCFLLVHTLMASRLHMISYISMRNANLYCDLFDHSL